MHGTVLKNTEILSVEDFLFGKCIYDQINPRLWGWYYYRIFLPFFPAASSKFSAVFVQMHFRYSDVTWIKNIQVKEWDFEVVLFVCSSEESLSLTV